MFAVEKRKSLRDRLVDAARADPVVTAAALVGSGATGSEDRWSDIDLALQLRSDEDLSRTADRWTEKFYDEYNAVHHLDMWSGDALYRVFLTDDTLQVDLSFWPAAAFGATGGQPFKLLFGRASQSEALSASVSGSTIGMGWLYALHARSAIARERSWQALYMLNGMRDQLIALACARADLSQHQARGVDDLPDTVQNVLRETFVRSLGPHEQVRAFAAITSALLSELQQVDPELAARLEMPLLTMVDTCQ